MPTFTLTPNFRVLNSYLTSTTDEEFDTANPGYEPHPIVNTLEWEVFNDEAAFEHAFKDLLTKYQLITHYDNLLHLTLYVYNEVWEEIQQAYDTYDSKKKARALAQLILLLKETKPGKLSKVSFSSHIDSVKSNDPEVNDWISATLIKALEAKDFPVAKFGTYVLGMLTSKGNPFQNEPIDIERIKQYANLKLVNPKNRLKKGMATISFAVYSYLEGETELKASEGVSFSDRQLNFLFELLELLKQVNRLEIDSDAKDYMRTLLMNFLR